MYLWSRFQALRSDLRRVASDGQRNFFRNANMMSTRTSNGESCYPSARAALKAPITASCAELGSGAMMEGRRRYQDHNISEHGKVVLRLGTERWTSGYLLGDKPWIMCLFCDRNQSRACAEELPGSKTDTRVFVEEGFEV